MPYVVDAINKFSGRGFVILYLEYIRATYCYVDYYARDFPALL
jgi:hypothetical protein